MTVPTTIDPGAWLSKHLTGEDGDGDLARALLAAFAETLMSAHASKLCEAGYNERSDERVNSRNGYRSRGFDTRAGSIDLAVPRLRSGSYFPDWLLEPRRHAEKALGRLDAAAERYGALDALWSQADPDLREWPEVKRGLATRVASYGASPQAFSSRPVTPK